MFKSAQQHKSHQSWPLITASHDDDLTVLSADCDLIKTTLCPDMVYSISSMTSNKCLHGK